MWTTNIHRCAHHFTTQLTSSAWSQFIALQQHHYDSWTAVWPKTFWETQNYWSSNMPDLDWGVDAATRSYHCLVIQPAWGVTFREGWRHHGWIGPPSFLKHLVSLTLCNILQEQAAPALSPLWRKSTTVTPLASQKNMAIILHKEVTVLNFFLGRESVYYGDTLCHWCDMTHPGFTASVTG